MGNTTSAKKAAVSSHDPLICQIVKPPPNESKGPLICDTVKPPSNKSKGSKSGKKLTKNERLVEKYWCEAIRNQDIRSVQKFAGPGSVCHYKGADQSMPLGIMLEACAAVFASFPDHRVEWDSVKEVSPGTVIIKNFYGHGTNTGKPFTFGAYKAIPATGKSVKETPFTMVIAVVDGKMGLLQFDTRQGELYGPPGYYVQLGGTLGN